MLPYTDGKPMKRHAALAMNMHGGGGFEIWQHKDKVPEAPHFDLQYGDLGIYAAKIKTHDAEAAHKYFLSLGVQMLNGVTTDPGGTKTFFVKDPYNNIFQFVEEPNIYRKHNGHNSINGGVYGATIGVSDFESAKSLYCDILGYDEIVYDVTGEFEDSKCLPGGEGTFRRVLLRHREERVGPFSKLLGPTQLELVTSKERTPGKIFSNRLWGDLGFIHLCFDVRGMDSLRTECESHGYPFTVDSADSFDMGVAAGHFAYVEDPDGTLIEFVETHKLPIVKKIGWYMNLKKRKPHKALPNWMVNTLEFGRVSIGDL
jgi:catechol 2,3-dioxygenase-like lactoylglutathione lyase family enzyme